MGHFHQKITWYESVRGCLCADLLIYIAQNELNISFHFVCSPRLVNILTTKLFTLTPEAGVISNWALPAL